MVMEGNLKFTLEQFVIYNLSFSCLIESFSILFSPFSQNLKCKNLSNYCYILLSELNVRYFTFLVYRILIAAKQCIVREYSLENVYTSTSIKVFTVIWGGGIKLSRNIN